MLTARRRHPQTSSLSSIGLANMGGGGQDCRNVHVENARTHILGEENSCRNCLVPWLLSRVCAAGESNKDHAHFENEDLV